MPPLLVCAELGVAAGGGAARISRADRPPQLAHRHDAGGQRAGLVGADDRRAAERLDRRQPPHEHVARRHPLHADRQRDRHDRRQALGHGRDRERHRREEDVDQRPARAASPSSATTATIARHRYSRVRLTRASRLCSGVALSWRSASRCAMSAELGASSRSPTTSAMPGAGGDRRAHETRGRGARPAGVSGRQASCDFSTGALSPVSARLVGASARAPRCRRASAATMSPASSTSRSPGTICVGWHHRLCARRARPGRAAPSSTAARARRAPPYS